MFERSYVPRGWSTPGAVVAVLLCAACLGLCTEVRGQGVVHMLTIGPTGVEAPHPIDLVTERLAVDFPVAPQAQMEAHTPVEEIMPEPGYDHPCMWGPPPAARSADPRRLKEALHDEDGR